jgi:hypothetical protein
VPELWSLGHSTPTVISELEDAIIEIERTVSTLRRGSCGRWAEIVSQHLADVRGTAAFTQKQALFKIGELCHPKALGDAGVSDSGWQAQLERLHDTCARAFNRLEKSVA